jgi:hypothetical protein
VHISSMLRELDLTDAANPKAPDAEVAT